jgi:hypothetical protein
MKGIDILYSGITCSQRTYISHDGIVVASGSWKSIIAMISNCKRY